MTTELPRTIPSDPAEQERLMPDWVKEQVCRLWNDANQSAYPYHYAPKDVVRARIGGLFALALTIWRWMPAPVDPVEEIVERLFEDGWRNLTEVRKLLREAVLAGQALAKGDGA